MRFLISLLIIFFSNKSFSLTENSVSFVAVPNYEKLFVRQLTPVWCWAALSEAVRNYNFPDENITQIKIAMDNPNIVQSSYETYSISPNYEKGGYDYLMNDILTHKDYVGFFEKDFKTNKVISLINDGIPVIVNYNFHVVMFYGYFKIGYFTYFKVFDPNHENVGLNPLFNINSLDLEDFFGNSYSAIIYMKKN